MFVIKTQNICFFYKEAKVKPRETLYINAKHAIVSDDGFVRLFDERGEQIFMGSLTAEPQYTNLNIAIEMAMRGAIVEFTDISAEEV